MSEKKRWKVLYFPGYVIPILLVFYVLSYGPAYAIVLSIGFNTDPPHPSELVELDPLLSFENLESLYAPLVWAGDKNPYIEELLYDYWDFCFEMMYPE